MRFLDIIGQEEVKKQFGITGESHDIFLGVSRRLAQGDDYRVYGDITLDLRNTNLL